MKTNIQKAIALVSIVGILILNAWNAFAVKIGEGIVTDTTWNAVVTPVDINQVGTSASGSITGIKVTANVGPVLSLTIDKSLIDLGNISGFVKSGSLKLEAGTNSPNWLRITATSQNGWLGQVSGTGLINSATPGAAYAFASASGNGATDFTSPHVPAFRTPTSITTPGSSIDIYSTTMAEKHSTTTDDIEFTVTATAWTASFPDWDYEDLITFTISTTF
jgi:hypothetical protein